MFAKAGLAIAVLGLLFTFATSALAHARAATRCIAVVVDPRHARDDRTRVAAGGALTSAAVWVAATAALLIGVDAVSLAKVTVLGAAMVLPFIHFALPAVARDRKLMGVHANGRLANALGWF